MTREERTELIKSLKYSRSIGADYTITDNDADEIIKALEQAATAEDQKMYRDRVYNYFGVSEKIVESNYSESEYDAFCKSKEPFLFALSLCKDCISRAEVFEQIDCWIGSGEYRYKNATWYLERRINSLSRVQPNTEWIPVSERPPKEKGYYITTTLYEEVYCDYWNGEKFERTETVIAWMPLPKPY